MTLPLLLFLAGSPQSQTPFIAKDSVLTLDGLKILPLKVGMGAPISVTLATGTLTIDRSRLTFVDEKGSTWAASAGAEPPTFLAADHRVIYLAAPHSLTASEEDKTKGSQILRLDLKTGVWLRPIVLAEVGKVDTRLAGMAIKDGKIALLVTRYKPPYSPDEISRYELRVLNSATGDIQWSAEIPGKAEFYSFWHIADGIKTVQWAKDNVVVCANQSAPILSFTSNGTLAWRLDRPWEFERGYIGPSSFTFYLARTGMEKRYAFEHPDLTKESPENKSIRGQIVAGPIWVPNTGKSADLTQKPMTGRLVVAIGRGPARGSTENCILFEISEQGNPITCTTMPFFVDQGNWQSFLDGIVFPASNGAMLRLRSSTPAASMIQGPFGHRDLTARIDWLIQDAPPEAEERLNLHLCSSEGPRDDVVTYTHTKAIRASEGWYCDTLKKAPVTFPIQIVDLTTGMRSACTFTIPLSMAIPRPTTGFTETGGSFSTMTPYLVQIFRLEARGHNLRIFLDDGTGHHPTYVDFPLPPQFR